MGLGRSELGRSRRDPLKLGVISLSGAVWTQKVPNLLEAVHESGTCPERQILDGGVSSLCCLRNYAFPFSLTNLLFSIKIFHLF